MKVKISIIKKFIESTLIAGFCVGFLFYLFFSAFCYFFPSHFHRFMRWYNNSYLAIAGLMLLFLIIMVGTTFTLFVKKMNPITDMISNITDTITQIANGNIEASIDHNSKDELGILADHVNIMALKLKKAMEQEKDWNEQRYQMITNLSHDLKTPMMSINGYVDRVRNKQYQNEEELEKYCIIIHEKIDELNSEINQLFELSKISSRDYCIQKQQIGLAQFMEQVLMSFIPKMENVQMESFICIEQKQIIYADIDLFKRVCENLINNAIKYGAKGKKMYILAETDDQYVKIIFRNYGEMIPKEECEYIFERYYREKKNDKKEGSGCGLAIVKQIVELHQGKICVESSEEKTDFCIFIPMVEL